MRLGPSTSPEKKAHLQGLLSFLLGGSVAVAAGANAALHPEHVRQAKQAICSDEVLIMQLEIPVETARVAAEIASAHDTKVILNPAPAQPLDSHLLQHVIDVKRLGSRAANRRRTKNGFRSKDRCGHVTLRGVSAVLVTQGRWGTYVATRSEEKVINGFEPRAVGLTAAAGDRVQWGAGSSAL